MWFSKTAITSLIYGRDGGEQQQQPSDERVTRHSNNGREHQADEGEQIDIDLAELVEEVRGLKNATQHYANAVVQQSNTFKDALCIVSENNKEVLRIVSENNKEAVCIASENSKAGMLALAEALKIKNSNSPPSLSTPPSTPRRKASNSARRARKAVESAEKPNVAATGHKPRAAKTGKNWASASSTKSAAKKAATDTDDVSLDSWMGSDEEDNESDHSLKGIAGERVFVPNDFRDSQYHGQMGTVSGRRGATQIVVQFDNVGLNDGKPKVFNSKTIRHANKRDE